MQERHEKADTCSRLLAEIGRIGYISLEGGTMWSLVVDAIGYGIGILSAIASIWQFIESRNNLQARRRAIICLIASFLVISGTYFGTYATFASRTSGSAILPNSTSNSSTNGTNTVVTPTPSPTAAPTPTPSPTSIPRLYSSDWSKGMDGWTGGSDWSALNGMLVNNGTQYESNGEPSIITPYLPASADYVVQADIQLVRYSDGGAVTAMDDFGIVVRSPNEGGGYKLSICGSSGLGYCGTGKNNYEALLSNGDPVYDTPLAESPLKPPFNWHNYRIEVKGNTITVSIDGGFVFQATDNKYLAPGRVGLWSDRCQISARNFKITLL